MNLDFSDKESDFSDDDSKCGDNYDFNKEETETNILNQIDRKLIIKYMKEGKSSRTYIYGLSSYIDSEDQIMNHAKKIQKSLGTSILKRHDDDNKIIIGFGGEHIRTIYEYIIKNNICPINEIKK